MAKTRKQTRRASGRQSRPSSSKPPSRFPEVVQGLSVLQTLSANARHRESTALAEQLLRIEPDNPHVNFHAGLAFDAAGQADRAETCYRQSLKLDPAHAGAAVQFAAVAARTFDFPSAITALGPALKASPDNPQLHHLAGQLYDSVQQHDLATQHFQVLARLRPQHAAFELLAQAAMAAGDLETSRSAFKNAMKFGSKPAHVHAALARLEAGHGDAETAVAHLFTALREDPADGFAYLQLATDFADHVNPQRLLDQATAAAALPDDTSILAARSIPMCFAIARLHELLDQTDTAFAYYQRANASLAGINAYQPANDPLYQAGVPSKVDDSEISHGNPTLAPVFVFGLPRSGTTLLEQIFRAHPDISGLGEHEAFGWISRYVATATADRLKTAADFYLMSYGAECRSAARVIDKSMSTPEHLASILKVFPNAHFIHCVRHPMETAWSMYSMYFGERRVPYANTFEGIASRTMAVSRVMASWRAQLPGRIHTVRYDDLVKDMATTVTAGLRHIGLDWHDDCANFHTARTMVRTASITQVRQPLFTTASQKWRRYEAHLAPLIERLAPLIESYDSGNPTGY